MEDNLAFLCSDVARLFRREYAEKARLVGGTGPQWRGIMLIERCPGITQGALAERLDVEPITACRLVDRMEQAGLVERRRDPADRRVWQLFLTPSAAPVSAKLRAIGEDLLEYAASGFAESELETLRALLLRLRNNLAADQDVSKVERHG